MNTDASPTIQPGSEVVLHCRITFRDGTVAENTFGHDPIRLVVGEEDVMIRNLQLALYGLKAGDKQSLWIDPQYAFGMPDEEAIQYLPRSDFPADMELTEGLIVAFSTPAGEDVPGAILEVTDDQVKVDFNHPLAGREIQFEVEILEVHPPAEAE